MRPGISINRRVARVVSVNIPSPKGPHSVGM